MRIFTLAEAYEKTNSIIVGLVTECAQAKSADGWTSGGDQCSFVAMEVLKESMPTRDYAGVADSSGCGLSLYVGQQYLLYLDEQNRPIWYSEPLKGRDWNTLLVEQRVEILRDFRDGVNGDLSEPWISRKTIFGNCSLTHAVSGHRIIFSIRPLDAVPIEEMDWNQMVVDGRPMFSPEQANEIRRQIKESPIRPLENVHVMKVSLHELSPNAPRNVSIRVGARVWPLERREHTWDETDRVTAPITTYNYSVKGDIAEEILAALETPSNIVVTATLVSQPADTATSIDSASGVEVEPELQAQPANAFFGVSIPQDSMSDPTDVERQTATQRANQPEPEPVLRFDTRSTNLAKTIDEYRSCYRTNE